MGQNLTQVDYNATLRDKPINKKILLILAIGCCNCATGYIVLVNTSLQYCVDAWGMSLTAVQQISNLPAIISLLGSVLAAPLISRFGRKIVGSVSMLVLVITGVLPAIITTMDYMGILVTRGIGGLFAGTLIPIGTSLAADYFAGTQKRFMMGFNMAFSSILCGVGLNQVAGALCASGVIAMGPAEGWRNTYWVFAPFIVLFVIILIGVPHPSKEQRAAEKASGQGGKITDVFAQNGKVWKYAIFMFFWLICGHIHSITAATIVAEKGFGDANIIATSFSIMTAGGAIGGLFYAFFCKPIKKFSMAFMLAISAVGFLLVGLSTNLAMFFVGVFLGCGVCFIGIVSLINSLVGSNASAGKVVGALALANIAYHAGEFATPLILNPISAAVFGADAAGNPLGSGVYLTGACLSVILCVVALISALKTKQGEGDHLLDF